VHFIVRIISDSFHSAPSEAVSGVQDNEKNFSLAKKLHVVCWKNFCPGFGKTLIPAIIRLAVASVLGRARRGGNFAILGLCCLLALHLMSWRVLLNLRICAQTTFRWHQSDRGRWAEDNYLGGRLARLRCVHPK